MAQKDVTLGVEIGGTTTTLGYVDKHGTCFGVSSMATHPHQQASTFFRRLHEDSQELLTSIKESLRVVGIGIGAPNANYYRGTIEQPPNLSWHFVDVVSEMHRYAEVPVAVTNDANAAALGEKLFGAAQGMKDFIVIMLDTGLGSGIVVNGELVYGADGFAGEIGHTIVDPDGRACGCGRKGCLETYASAKGICRTVQELIATTTDESELRHISFERLNETMVRDAARRGDRLAIEAFERTGRILGMKLADSVAHLSPEAIILFGCLADSGELIFQPTKRSMEEHLLGIFKGKVKLLPSGLQNGNTAVLGASALIWNDIHKGRRLSTTHAA
jgi:glucokinase